MGGIQQIPQSDLFLEWVEFSHTDRYRGRNILFPFVISFYHMPTFNLHSELVFFFISGVKITVYFFGLPAFITSAIFYFFIQNMGGGGPRPLIG